MGKIRHIAIQVPDLERAATFYEGVFGLERVNQVESPVGNAISLSDGIMNLTLLHFPVDFVYGALLADYAIKSQLLAARFRSGRWQGVRYAGGGGTD